MLRCRGDGENSAVRSQRGPRGPVAGGGAGRDQASAPESDLTGLHGLADGSLNLRLSKFLIRAIVGGLPVVMLWNSPQSLAELELWLAGFHALGL